MQRTTSRRTEQKPPRSRAGWMGLIALCCALAGCAGGSGSSGFEIAAENNAIQKALDTDECEIFEGLTICPAASPAPTDTPVAPAATPSSTPSATETQSQGNLTQTPTDHGTVTPTTSPPMVEGTPSATTTLPPPSPTRTVTPTSTIAVQPRSPTPTATTIPSQPNVETNLSSSDTLPCLPDTASTCTLVFEFHPVGLPSSAVYRVAVRTRNPDGEWLVMDTPNNRVAIEVSTADLAQQYQFAVLVFMTDPGFVPETVSLLSDTGADLAFVTPSLSAAEI